MAFSDLIASACDFNHRPWRSGWLMLIPTMKKPRAHLCETGAVVSVYKFVIDLKEVRQNGLCFSSIASGHRSAPHFL